MWISKAQPVRTEFIILIFIQDYFLQFFSVYVLEMRDNAFEWLTTKYNADYAPANGEEPIPDDKEPAL